MPRQDLTRNCQKSSAEVLPHALYSVDSQVILPAIWIREKAAGVEVVLQQLLALTELPIHFVYALVVVQEHMIVTVGANCCAFFLEIS